MHPSLKPVQAVPIPPPPADQHRHRSAVFAPKGTKRDRYHLPEGLQSGSPVGYRTRASLTSEEATQALGLLSLGRPAAFVADGAPILEEELFEQSALGVLVSRQSTNYRGHRQISLGAEDSAKAAGLLREIGMEAPVLDHALATHFVLSRPYRTPFTLLLTLIGHKPVLSLLTVPLRAYRKRVHLRDDIPTIGYLQHLHVGILADAMDRAVVVSSGGRRRAQVFQRAFCSATTRSSARTALESLIGLTPAERRQGWRISIVAQEGEVAPDEQVRIPRDSLRKIGANLMSFRSERIQPGVNQEERAPEAYQHRQDMDVPEDLVEQAGRAGFNAFCHWTGVDRDTAKKLVVLERVDVLTDAGKGRLREIRKHLLDVTEQVVKSIPLWADLPTGRAFSRNAARGKKAFALAGQRIYIGGLCRDEVEAAGLEWNHAVRCAGALAARGTLVAEIMGTTQIPDGCDLLAGTCLMAGPVNQNDVGKSFYGHQDLLAKAAPGRHPTSLLVWTLKAKTVADPIGNEQQLMDAERKGALVDLRPAPHEVVEVVRGGQRRALRAEGNTERAFGDVGNFVRAPNGAAIPGNEGSPWDAELRKAPAF
ncbi:MAG: hypothetical protein AB8H79_00695 [Myxococcota bacterium]